ncbi:DUF3152 domain-containing protein [Plantactinospora sp. B5E13]|uniref:DUF3152 domain-containing protein n=1 Tax=unclassified Plantactinospora TaxID=2631981 RepID=UPI00325C620F
MPARHAGTPRPSATRRLFLPALAVVVVGLVVGVVGVVEAIGNPHPDTGGGQVAALPPAPHPGEPAPGRVPPSPTRSPEPPPIRYPESGPQSWRTVAGRSPVLGEEGQLMRFRVAVEKGITGITPEDFADAAVATLGDPRSWTGSGDWRLQRVGPKDTADFTLYLATPATRDKLCADGYDRYTSCRNGASVVINVARWAHGVPNYGAPLAAYRQYVINHEVGHRLGHGHELCPGRGKVAPVMQQQTLGMHGCKPNSWPLRDGKPYAGRPGQYDDPIPRDDH